MENSTGLKAQEFALVSISELGSSSSSSSSPAVALFSAENGVAELRFQPESESAAPVNVDLQTAKVCFSYLDCCFDLIVSIGC